MSDTLSKQLEEYRAGWMQRVPADRRAIMERHIAHLTKTEFAQRAKQVGDQAPTTFYRGGWCPYCNLELKAYQAALPRIAAAGASLVAISPEKPDDTVSTAEKNALTFPVLSDVGQSVGKTFGIVYAFTDELRSAYHGFNLDIPAKNGTPDDWSLPLSATYVIGADGVILFADIGLDYRRRTDPLEVLNILERRAAAE